MAWTRVGSGGVVLCLCEVCVWILCVDGRSRFLYIVLGRYMCILGLPIVQSCYALSISAAYHVLFAGGEFFDTICTAVCQNRCGSSTTCRLCRLDPHVLSSTCSICIIYLICFVIC